MNISQKQTILDEIQALQQLDLDSIIIHLGGDNMTVDSIMIGKYSASDYKKLLNKSISQLKSEIENGFGLLLPNQEIFHNDYGQVTLDKDLNRLRTSIQNDINASVDILDKIIYYQIRQGFWDRSKVKMHSVNEERVNSLLDRVDLIVAKVEISNQQAEDLNSDLSLKISDLESFLTLKRQEFEEVKALETNANTLLASINEVVATATNKDTEISGLVSNINDKISTVTKNIDEYQDEYSLLVQGLNTCQNDLQDSLNSAKIKLEGSQQSLDFIESKRGEIIRLTGMAADGSLGSKFDQRQIKLSTGLNFWKWTVPAVTVLAVFWVFAVFMWIPSEVEISWIKLLINIIKTTPAFILVGFVYKQYSKERNLQEEYAFKSAVAMTLTAYSSMLESRDEDSNKSRQEMLVRSIQQLYEQPKIHLDHKDRTSLVDLDKLKETISTLTETVKNLKSNL